MTNPLHDAAMAAKKWADAVLQHMNSPNDPWRNFFMDCAERDLDEKLKAIGFPRE